MPLPRNYAKYCFLNEEVHYLACGYVPTTYVTNAHDRLCLAWDKRAIQDIIEKESQAIKGDGGINDLGAYIKATNQAFMHAQSLSDGNDRIDFEKLMRDECEISLPANSPSKDLYFGGYRYVGLLRSDKEDIMKHIDLIWPAITKKLRDSVESGEFARSISRKEFQKTLGGSCQHEIEQIIENAILISDIS